MDIISARKGWLLSIILTGLVTVIVSKLWLFQEAACPNLQDLLLYASTAVVVLMMCWHAITTPQVAPLGKLNAIGIVLATILIVPPVAGTFMAQFPAVRAQYCASCDELLKSADALVQAAKGNNSNPADSLTSFKSAEYFIRQCVARNEALSGKEAQTRLAYLLVDKSAVIPAGSKCTESKNALDEAYTLAGKYGLSDFRRVIELEQRNLDQLCAIPPTPTFTPTWTRTPTPTKTPTSTPTSTPSPTPTFTPTPAPPPGLCNGTTMRISHLAIKNKAGLVVSIIPTTARSDIRIPFEGTIEILGAAFLNGRVAYEVRYVPIDVANLPKSSWSTVGSRVDKRIGDEINNGLLVEWRESDRKALAPGRYALTVRMFLPDGNYTLERDTEPCWIFVEIR